MPTTHVVFVGPERDFLMGSISLLREVGFSRIVLVTGNDPKFSGEALIQKMLLSPGLSLLTIFTTEMWSYRLGHKQA